MCDDKMKFRTLGMSGLRVSAVGLGCMGLSHAYGTPVNKNEFMSLYNPQNEMFAHFQTKCIIFKNETQLFKVIPHTPKISKKSTGFAGTLYI